MNDQIRQLAEQVGAVRNVLAMGRHDGVLFTESELEKFAELIVRECMLICGAIQGAAELKNMSEFASGAAQCEAIIKRDFGVEG